MGKEQSRNSTAQQESTNDKEKIYPTIVTIEDLDLMEEFISLRTVPVVVSNIKVRMTVNALLDDASTKNIPSIVTSPSN